MCQINDPKIEVCYGCARVSCECPPHRCTRGGDTHQYSAWADGVRRCNWCTQRPEAKA